MKTSLVRNWVMLSRFFYPIPGPFLSELGKGS